MLHYLKLLVFISFLFFIACSGSSTNSSIINDLTVSLDNTNMQFQEAQALLLQESTVSYSTSSGSVTTNLLQMLADELLVQRLLCQIQLVCLI